MKVKDNIIYDFLNFASNKTVNKEIKDGKL